MDIFGLEINSASLTIMGVMFFFGVTFGWLCRKGNLFFIVVGLLLFSSLFEWMKHVDLWFITLPFILGFLVHTAKPLWRKITQ